MKLWGRNGLILFITLTAFIALGVIGLLVTVARWLSGGDYIVLDLIVALIFLAPGVGGFMYTRLGYMGGAPTIVGALLILFSFVFGVMAIAYPELGAGNQKYAVFFFVMGFLVAGIYLLKSGHEFHLLRKEREKSVDDF